jgi:hypothetical protein
MRRTMASLSLVMSLPLLGNARSISTNKDRLLTIAVQGQVAPAQPARAYAVTWDGRPKIRIDPNASTAYYLGIRVRPRSWHGLTGLSLTSLLIEPVAAPAPFAVAAVNAAARGSSAPPSR